MTIRRYGEAPYPLYARRDGELVPVRVLQTERGLRGYLVADLRTGRSFWADAVYNDWEVALATLLEPLDPRGVFKDAQRRAVRHTRGVPAMPEIVPPPPWEGPLFPLHGKRYRPSPAGVGLVGILYPIYIHHEAASEMAETEEVYISLSSLAEGLGRTFDRAALEAANRDGIVRLSGDRVSIPLYGARVVEVMALLMAESREWHTLEEIQYLWVSGGGDPVPEHELGEALNRMVEQGLLESKGQG